MSCLIKESYMDNKNPVHSLNKETFNKLCQSLEIIAVSRGYEKGIITAQISLETGHGKSIIDNNLFNIKATGSWLTSGTYVVVGTHEYINGVKTYIPPTDKNPPKFRKYASYEESLKDYINLISTTSFYRLAWNSRHDPYLYFYYLINTGDPKYKYATDPTYPKKCLDIFEALT